ncbi:DNRLRE domain-containing protein [Sorangium sp. So ce375]|uniref:DNRLRE domain-containing protein n=1 Tax=Sorangium sp. So ce375 TaxID=3133306 RepID=UPI003F5B79FA
MRTLTVARLAISVLLSAAACAQPAEIVSREDSGEGRSAVIGADARADNTHTAVVSLDGGCSGTIVRRSADGDKVHVLTAAHCCWPSAPKKVLVGPDFLQPSKALDVDAGSVALHPCYNVLNNDHDVCVVTARGAGDLDVTPIPLASAPDDVTVGSAVTVVGYGGTPAQNSIRRRAEARVSEVEPLTIVIDQSDGQGGVCFGDSGGPALIQQNGVEVVAGVSSFVARSDFCGALGALGRVAVPGVRSEFLDKVLAGEESTLDSRLILRGGITPGQVRDTYIASDQPEQSFGGRADLLVGAPRGTDAVRRALLRFDLSADPPRGATLLMARVGLRVASTSGPATISVHRVVKDWDESESWASFAEDGFDPAPVAVSGGVKAIVEDGQVLSFDVTGLVLDWLRGEAENYGILLRSDDREQIQLFASDFSSDLRRPWMQLCYVPKPR